MSEQINPRAPNLKPWSAADDANMIRMRNVEHMGWPDIAKILGRSRTASHARYMRLVPIDERVNVARRKSWSDEDAARVLSLRTEKKSYREIAAITGMTLGQVTSKLERMARPGRRVHFERETSKFIIPKECLEDRDRRMSAGRDLTATFFGDPPKGYSALERRA